jgi:hypothetical protein
MWKLMQHEDADTVVGISKLANDKQTDESIALHLEQHPENCYVYTNADGIIGYAIGYPGVKLEPPAPDSLIGRSWQQSKEANTFFIESITIMETMEDIDPESEIMAAFTDAARALMLSHMSMVCAPGTESYWQTRFLFSYEEDMMMDIWVQSGGYPDGSKYLQRKIY